ncbi:MAG: hypothetical protein M3Y53_04805 [Thermoproteota archaeon]|nr:hypothetical protein [Thermoproteota archaeon]
MLQKETRKNLTNHKWVYIANHDSNPPQRFHRIRIQVAKAFRDLELLLGVEFPEEKEKQLFSPDRITKLAQALLKSPTQNQTKYLDQTRRTEIALRLAEVGLGFLISQYELLSERTPFIGQTTINELERAVGICSDIADEVQSRYIESKTQREKTVHIFDWDRVPGRHEQRLKKFLIDQIRMMEKMGYATLRSFRAKKDKNNEKLECRIELSEIWEYEDGEPDSDDFSFNAIITIQSENRAMLHIKDNHNDKEIHKQDLVVHKENKNLYILNKE